MDTIPGVIDWPKHPYRGLDFYREADTRLFCERDKDVRECADILLGFGVKILLLQGSSGSGKSSFLRAGLVPYLKRDPRQTFFLGGKDCVIRCTSDPLPEIARSLVSSFENSGAFAAAPDRRGDGGGEALVEEIIRVDVCRSVEEALTGSREQLADAVLGAFVAVCADLPGKLILVLDQAEEVLTRSRGGRIGDEASAAFFHFLEDIYLRNVDARLVVALRTEYYGRFRDELRISDDRLSNRPRSGGVEPYLLRPLRAKNALMRVVEVPTSARTAEGIPVYDFGFQDGLIERIVDDLVQAFPHMAVTPALQLVCASLYERLTRETRTITHADYNGLGRINGIFGSYLERGISVAEPRTEAQVDQWHLLLHSLVSRQGGGTLVSLIEPADEIVREARELGLQSAIEPALVRLTHGAAPLLRGEPPDEPRNFSLKHDVLALVLARRYAEHEGALKAKKEEAVKRHWMLAIGVGAFAMLCLFFAFIVYDRGEAALAAKTKAVDLTNRYAIRAPEGNFRRSLLLALANLDAAAQPSDFYERIMGDSRPYRGSDFVLLSIAGSVDRGDENLLPFYP